MSRGGAERGRRTAVQLTDAPRRLVIGIEAYPSLHPNKREAPMGDKSPKSKDKQKKQDTAGKDQKKAAAAKKAAPPPAPAKKGK